MAEQLQRCTIFRFRGTGRRETLLSAIHLRLPSRYFCKHISNGQRLAWEFATSLLRPLSRQLHDDSRDDSIFFSKILAISPEGFTISSD
jgi:hypothetical protein